MAQGISGRKRRDLTGPPRICDNKTMPKTTKSSRPKGGRPAKFDEPSRPITVTLPERTLLNLARIDADRAVAIAKAVDAVVGGVDAPEPMVGELPISKGRALLTVADNRLLRTIPWLTLIEIAPGRHILSADNGISVEQIEVSLVDLLETATDATDEERAALRLLLDRLRTPRRNRAVQVAEILVIQSRGTT